jgi:hypothetical protein
MAIITKKIEISLIAYYFFMKSILAQIKAAAVGQ